MTQRFTDPSNHAIPDTVSEAKPNTAPWTEEVCGCGHTAGQHRGLCGMGRCDIFRCPCERRHAPTAAKPDHYAIQRPEGHPIGCRCKPCNKAVPVDAEGRVLPVPVVEPEQPAHATDFRDSRNTKAQPEPPTCDHGRALYASCAPCNRGRLGQPLSDQTTNNAGERNPWGYRDRLAVAALAWHDAQNDMTQDRGEAHRMLMREASDYRKREGLDHA